MKEEYIYETAVTLFRHRGIRATRMDDVATCLQISKRTLYERFSSKEDFLLACIRYEMDNEKEVIDRLASKFTSPLKHIIKLYTHSIRYLTSFHPCFFRDLRQFPECDRELDRYIALLRVRFNNLLLGCISLGLCIEDFDTFLFSTFLSMRLEDIKNGVANPKEKVNGISRFVVYSMLMGYSTEKGKQAFRQSHP